MIQHYMVVQQIEAALEKLRHDADVIEGILGENAATPLRSVLITMEKALIVDLDQEVDSETARKATGKSARQLRRLPRTGNGTDARWTVRDLVEYYGTREGLEIEEDVRAAPHPDRSEERHAAAVEAALRVAGNERDG